jgi:septal ring-binding cell division protein DamX
VTVAAAKPPAGVVGTTKAAALPVGGPAKSTAPTQTATPAPAKAAAPAAKPPAAAPADAPIQLAGAAPAGFTPAFNAGGKFAVQIAAPATEAGAQAEWAKAARKAPELFGSAERIIVQAEVNGKAVYRVRAGAFATSADADAFCNAFKAKGGACYRVAK